MTDSSLSGRVDNLETYINIINQALLQRPDLTSFYSYQNNHEAELNNLESIYAAVKEQVRSLATLYSNLFQQVDDNYTYFTGFTGTAGSLGLPGVDGREVTGSIIPDTSGAYNIGSSGQPFGNLISNTGVFLSAYSHTGFLSDNNVWWKAKDPEGTGWVDILRVNTSGNLEFSNTIINELAFYDIEFEAGIVPTEPTGDGYKLYVEATGTSPNRSIIFYTLDKLGDSAIITSMLE